MEVLVGLLIFLSEKDWGSLRESRVGKTGA